MELSILEPHYWETSYPQLLDTTGDQVWTVARNAYLVLRSGEGQEDLAAKSYATYASFIKSVGRGTPVHRRRSGEPTLEHLERHPQD